jgi:hypothetical protein
VKAAEAHIHSFLTLTLDGNECSTSHPGCFIPGQTALTATKWDAGWVQEPVWAFLMKEKLPLPGFEPHILQPLT